MSNLMFCFIFLYRWFLSRRFLYRWL